MKRIPIALAVALALGALGACGDDDGADEAAVTTTAQDESEADATTTTEDPEDGELERDDPGADNTTPSQGLIELEAALEPPSSGAADASGVVAIQVDVDNRELCYTIGTQSIDDPTVAHIHDGLEGEDGPLVLALAPPQDGSVDGCIRKLEVDLATKIAGNPERYYVDVHDENDTAPTLRGQLEATP